MNAQKLSRKRSPNVDYEIRKQSYFGCVICGIAVGDYHHIDPEFHDAEIHDPDKMTFLCHQCHTKFHRGYISKDSILSAKSNPWCKKNKKCHESFDVSSDSLSVWIGNTKVDKVENIITIDGVCILSIKKPEEQGAPFRLSAIFNDNNNDEVLNIVDNIWEANSESFDIICSNGKIGIRDKDGKFALKLVCHPPHQIVVEEINMLYNGLTIVADQNGLKITSPRGGGVSAGNYHFSAKGEGVSLFSFSTKVSGLKIGGGCEFSVLSEKMPMKSISSVKFLRNSHCPCGSNVKYKKCCYPKYDYSL